MLQLMYPFGLAGLGMIPFYLYFSFRKSRGILYPSLEHQSQGKTLRIRLLFLPRLLYTASLVLWIIALCRPVSFDADSRDSRNGIILEMLLDRSGSMGTWMDTDQKENRLDIAKRTFLDFISRRENDVIGLVSFARYADTLSPLTGSHGIFQDFVASIDLAHKDEDGTAVGEALALGVARIESYRAGMPADSAPQAVMILLTDGQNNQGAITPQQASDLAEEKGITVYTIGFGGGYYRNAFGFWDRIPKDYGIDEKLLQEIAEKTGGLYFNAENEASLESIYEKIDKLEKTRLDTVNFTRKRELFQGFLLAGLVLMLLSLFLQDLFFPVIKEGL